MKYYSRRWIKSEDLNGHDRLFGGTLLSWVDEEAMIFASCQLGTRNLVTKHIGAINFVAPAILGDIIEFGLEVIEFGRTSIAVKCHVRNKETKTDVITVDKIVFVHVDREGRPQLHGKGLQQAI
jgi:acyl-CoA hydrolase